MPIARRIVATALAAAIITSTLVAGTAVAAPRKATTVATSSPITFAYAGDSITARSDSWWHQMQTDTRFQSNGGYARSGYRSDQVLAGITPTPADVLVVELGTNDVNQNVPADTIIANINAIITKVGARRTLIVALPPSNITSGGCCNTDRNRAATLFNRQLAVWAGYHGHVFFDPFVVYREADDTWTPGSDADGVHPTADSNVTLERWFAWGIQQANDASKS